MRFEVKTGAAAKLKTSCLMVPVHTSGALVAATRALNSATGGMIADLVDGGDIRGRIGDTLLISPGDAVAARRVMLVGCGDKDKFDRKQYRKALRAAYSALARTRHIDAISCLHLEAIKGADLGRRAQIAAEVWQNADYRFTTTKSDGANESPPIESLGLAAPSGKTAEIRKGLRKGEAIGLGMRLARELGNLPANVCRR
jgi:leucyl aminopeptidase